MKKRPSKAVLIRNIKFLEERLNTAGEDITRVHKLMVDGAREYEALRNKNDVLENEIVRTTENWHDMAAQRNQLDTLLDEERRAHTQTRRDLGDAINKLKHAEQERTTLIKAIDRLANAL